MSTTTLRHYNSTLSYLPTRSERRLRHAKKMARIRMSRRKFKQNVRTLLAKF